MNLSKKEQVELMATIAADPTVLQSACELKRGEK
jgi:hypothetical protein